MPDPTPSPAPTDSGTPGEGTPSPTPSPGPSPSPAPSPTPSPAPSPAPAATAWGDNWRETYADKDEKRLNVLKRYASPKDMLDAHFALKQRVDSGELKAVKALPANATPEQIAAYRTENGIPANAGDYLANLPNGLVIGEADKPALTNFAEAMHKANTPPAVVHQAIAWYNQWQEQQAADVVKSEREARSKGEDELRAAWGGDYKTNVNLANDFLTNTAGAELSEALSSAVLPDGTLFGDNPKALQWLAQIAREVNPVATLVPSGAGGGSAATVDTEIAEIEKLMRTNRAEYNRDEGKQKRLHDLYAAREKLQARKAG
jgi:hypothetical protein